MASAEHTYDKLDRLVETKWTDTATGDTKTYGYQYSSDGNLAGLTENGELVYMYDYDTLGRLIHSSELRDGETVLYTDHQYDTSDRILRQNWQIGAEGFEEHYEYNKNDGTLKTMVVQGDTLNFAYDSLKRLSSKNIVQEGSSKGALTYNYYYKDGADTNQTTNQIASIQYVKPSTGGVAYPTIYYTYDVLGNITKVQPNGKTATEYTYDSQNQLLTETTGTKNHTYTYDTYGNIRNIASTTSSGTENWKLNYNK